MIPSLSTEPKFRLIHSAIGLSDTITQMEFGFDQLILEGVHNPHRAKGGLVTCVLEMAKRNDPMLQTYSVHLAKLILTMHLFGNLLDKKHDRTAIILKDIFGKVDDHHVKQSVIQTGMELTDIMKRAIASSFATRKMKISLKDRIDTMYDTIANKIKRDSDQLRSLTMLIKRGGRTTSDYENLETFLHTLMDSK